MKKLLFLLLVCFLQSIPFSASGSSIKDDETIIFFPTNAALDADGKVWVVPVHGWIFEKEEDSFWRKVTIDSLSGTLEVEPDDASWPIYEKRTQMFLVDNERGKEIEVELSGKRTEMGESEANGHFYGTVYVDRNRVGNQGKKEWLPFQAVTQKDDNRTFQGKAHLIGPTGISVVSDIDDTIKISNVQDKEALVKNTFLKEFAAVPGMAELYRSWAEQGAVFHYLSASPWQLYPALSDFISKSGFPDGSYNLKNFRMKDETFFNLFSSQEGYKRPIIEDLIKKYPGRRFILVGDAGEEDPEIFAKRVASHYPEHVLHIFIRDLSQDAAQKERYRKTFEGIHPSKWTIFKDGKDLQGFKLPK